MFLKVINFLSVYTVNLLGATVEILIDVRINFVKQRNDCSTGPSCWKAE